LEPAHDLLMLSLSKHEDALIGPTILMLRQAQHEEVRDQGEDVRIRMRMAGSG